MLRLANIALRIVAGLAVACVAAFAAAQAPQAQAPQVQAPQVESGNFKTEVLEASNRRPVFVSFYAVWCRPCRPFFATLDALATAYEGRAKIFSVDVDESPDVSSHFGIGPLPALVAFRDGEAVERLEGNKSESDVRAFLDRHVTGGR